MVMVQVELDGRRLGGSALLIPLADVWLSSNTCRKLSQQVLCDHLHRPEVLSVAEKISMFCMKQKDTITGSGRKARVDKDLANAAACLDRKCMSVIDLFSTMYLLHLQDYLPSNNGPSRNTHGPLRAHEAHPNIIRIPASATRPCSHVCKPKHI
jgi:hypothetical protein